MPASRLIDGCNPLFLKTFSIAMFSGKTSAINSLSPTAPPLLFLNWSVSLTNLDRREQVNRATARGRPKRVDHTGRLLCTSDVRACSFPYYQPCGSHRSAFTQFQAHATLASTVLPTRQPLRGSYEWIGFFLADPNYPEVYQHAEPRSVAGCFNWTVGFWASRGSKGFDRSLGDQRLDMQSGFQRRRRQPLIRERCGCVRQRIHLRKKQTQRENCDLRYKDPKGRW